MLLHVVVVVVVVVVIDYAVGIGARVACCLLHGLLCVLLLLMMFFVLLSALWPPTIWQLLFCYVAQNQLVITVVKQLLLQTGLSSC